MNDNDTKQQEQKTKGSFDNPPTTAIAELFWFTVSQVHIIVQMFGKYYAVDREGTTCNHLIGVGQANASDP